MAAFSTDVEDYFHAEALRRFCPRSEWDSLEDRTIANTDRLLGLLEARSVKGTFFVLGHVARKHPSLVKRIAAAGHEIASHGFDHELVYNQSPSEFREDVRRSRLLLQDLSGQPVIGYRAPSYTIMQRTLWALPILVEEGYLYDSSIFPIARRRYGMPRAERWAHRMEVGGGKAIAEFPLPTVRVWPVNLPVTGGAYLRLLPLSFQLAALNLVLRSGRPFVLNVHPWELDPEQPRMPVGLRTRWTHYHNLDRTMERLERLLGLCRYESIEATLRKRGLL